MNKIQKNIERIKKLKNAYYVKVESEPRLSPEKAKQLQKQGLHLYTFVETDDGEDIILSYFPRHVNHYCDVISTVDLGVKYDPKFMWELTYDQLDEAGAVECEDEEEFFKIVKKLNVKKVK